MAERRYDPQRDRAQWQDVWARERTWEVSNEGDRRREKSYVLEMLPYPSGEPHIGHLKNYALGDAIAHFHRRTGHRVLHPMGYDAFGLPAENHAIKYRRAPPRSTDESIAAFQQAFRAGGSRSTGRGRSPPTSRPTTAGRSGSSCSCSSAAWPTARRPRSSGAPTTRRCWPTSR